MAKIKEITQVLEQFAPLAYQESYDNAGLIVGDPNEAVKGILLSLDTTESIVDEAISRNCNLIVAHHPIVFQGLKKLNGKNYVEKAIIKAIRHQIAIYATHTNLDNVRYGVNYQIGTRLGLQNMKILAPKSQILQKLTVFVPNENTDSLLEALAEAGAGNIGNYSHCSFAVSGTGTFKPNESAKPHLGKANELEKVQEQRIEVVFPTYLQGQVLAAMRQAHPYEEIAYYLYTLENQHQEVGSGMIGELVEEMNELDFLVFLKEKMNLKVIKHTEFLAKKIKKVAVCGGAGSFLLRNALANRADIFITADYKYHEFFDAEGKIIIADIGHYESEIFTTELLENLLKTHFFALPINITEINTNPVRYFLAK